MRTFYKNHFALTAMAIAALATTFLCARSEAVAQVKIVVGSKVKVSAGHPGWSHTEYAADADPSDPNRFMVCSMRFSQSQNQLSSGIYVTFDGGKSWKLGYNDASSRFSGVWDPACAYGLNQHAYFVALATPTPVPLNFPRRYESWTMDGDQATHFYDSSNGGRKWSKAIELSFIDRPELRIDRTTSLYRGRMYLYGNTPDQSLWLLYSTDGGQTWARSAETEVKGVAGQLVSRTEWIGPGTILPDGTLLLVTRFVQKSDKDPGQSSSFFGVAASTDGGTRINSPVSVLPYRETTCGEWLSGIASDNSRGPFHGRAYLIWGEEYHGQCSLLISHSDSKGVTWSAPVRIEANGPLDGHVGSHVLLRKLLPQIAVNNDGVVGIAWYDFRVDSRGRRYQRLCFSASRDGGESWLPSVPVSELTRLNHDKPLFAAWAHVDGGGRGRDDQRTDSVDVVVEPSPRSYHANGNAWPGDYAGGMTAGADGTFHTFWIDNQTGLGEMYTAQIKVRDNDDHSIGQDLTSLENVTSAVEVQYTSSVWNPRTKSVFLRYQLLNTSKDTIIMRPLKLKVTQLESDLGTPILLANGRASQIGTVLDLSRTIPRTGLAPGQTCKPQVLKVRLGGVNTWRSGQQGNVVHMKVMLYGKLRTGGRLQSNNGARFPSLNK